MHEELQLALETTSKLSEILDKNQGDWNDVLKYLESKHIEKFLNSLDALEAVALQQFALQSRPKESSSIGLRFLDQLWASAPTRQWSNRDFQTLADKGDGSKIVARLAEFIPDWIINWWIPRCKNTRIVRIGGLSLDDIMIDCLSLADFEEGLSKLPNEIVARIVSVKPDFIKNVPRYRAGKILVQILNGDFDAKEFVATLSEEGLPSDAVLIVDTIIGDTKNDTRLFNELVRKWQSPTVPNPVTSTIKVNHKAIDSFFRRPWLSCSRSSNTYKDKGLWDDKISSEYIGLGFEAAVLAAADNFKLELGFSIGLRIANAEVVPTREEIITRLKEIKINPSYAAIDNILPRVRLWALLRTFAKYQASSWSHVTELVGLRVEIESLASSMPVLWAESLVWILARSSELGDLTESITFALANDNIDVRNALETACDSEDEGIRLRASGLQTLANGIDIPSQELAKTLASVAARYMDGSPLFPHPLERLSSTWIGSLGVEGTLKDSIRRAANKFGDVAKNQGGDVEESLVGKLITYIEVEVQNIKHQITIAGSNHSQALKPVLSVSQRPLSKGKEEPMYGCDIAWLIKTSVHGQHDSVWADLVQVKKSAAFYDSSSGKNKADSWTIECEQLRKLLKWSATSAYWMIASCGTVLVVPAKHLMGILGGNSKRNFLKSFTAHYYELRAAAIPLEQYLVDLLIGQWLGTMSEDVINFVEGGNPNIRPRMVVEVILSIGQGNQ
jgi:hypothetical protein